MTWARSWVLAVAVAAAACESGADSSDDELLREDMELATAVSGDELDACAQIEGVTRTSGPASASVDAGARAASMLQPARDASVAGDLERARTLLRRAAELDGRNRDVAYLYARTSETLGDTATAVRQYCRFLTLAPSKADSSEARARLTPLLRNAGPFRAGDTLLQPGAVSVAGAVATLPRARPYDAGEERQVQSRPRTGTTHAAASAGAVASTQTMVVPPPVEPAPSVPARVQPAAPEVVSSAPVNSAPANNAPMGNAPMENTPVTAAPAPAAQDPGAGAQSSSSGTAVAVRPGQVGTSAPAGQRSPEAVRRSTGQGAVIGAVVGAAVGAAVGRDMRGAVAGAAVGGLLGAGIGHRTPGIARQ